MDFRGPGIREKTKDRRVAKRTLRWHQICNFEGWTSQARCEFFINSGQDIQGQAFG